eukprot:gene19324-23135_t
MPPFAVDAEETRLEHGVAQQAAMRHLRFPLTEVVETRAHVQFLAVRPDDGDVERHAERVDRAARGFRDVTQQLRSLQRIPQLLLHPLRAQGIEHQEMMIGALRGQPGHGLFQRGGRIAVQPGAIDGAV